MASFAKPAAASREFVPALLRQLVQLVAGLPAIEPTHG